MINRWIANIVTVAILGVLVDLIMPGDNLKKYARFFIGLVTMIILIEPALKVFNQLPELEKHIKLNTTTLHLESIGEQSNNQKNNYNEYLGELYRGQLETHIKSEVKTISGHNAVDAMVELKISKEGVVEGIEKVYLEIGSMTLASIKPIEIAVGATWDEGIKNKSLSEDEITQLKSIKQYICETYKIHESQVIINQKS